MLLYPPYCFFKEILHFKNVSSFLGSYPLEAGSSSGGLWVLLFLTQGHHGVLWNCLSLKLQSRSGKLPVPRPQAGGFCQ